MRVGASGGPRGSAAAQGQPEGRCVAGLGAGAQEWSAALDPLRQRGILCGVEPPPLGAQGKTFAGHRKCAMSASRLSLNT